MTQTFRLQPRFAMDKWCGGETSTVRFGDKYAATTTGPLTYELMDMGHAGEHVDFSLDVEMTDILRCGYHDLAAHASALRDRFYPEHAHLSDDDFAALFQRSAEDLYGGYDDFDPLNGNPTLHFFHHSTPPEAEDLTAIGQAIVPVLERFAALPPYTGNTETATRAEVLYSRHINHAALGGPDMTGPGFWIEFNATDAHANSSRPHRLVLKDQGDHAAATVNSPLFSAGGTDCYFAANDPFKEFPSRLIVVGSAAALRPALERGAAHAMADLGDGPRPPWT